MDILDLTKLTESDFLEKLNLETLASTQKLGDPTAVKEVLEYSLPPLLPIEVDANSIDLSLRSSALLRHSTQLFNEENDSDEDLILGVSDHEGSILSLNIEFPVLKHTLSFSVSSGAELAVNKLQFGIKTGAHLKTLAYFRHQKDETVRKALMTDIKGMSFAFFLPQLKALDIGEALAIVSDASLSFNLNFEMGDIVSAGISGISKYASAKAPISLEIELGGNIGVDFAVEGAYKLIFVKRASEKYGFYLKSAVSNTATTAVEVGARASFSNPALVEDFLTDKMDSLLSQITGLNGSELDEIEKKLRTLKSDNLSILDLSEIEKKVVEILVEKLNIRDQLNQLTALINKIASIRGELKNAFKEAAESKITAGFNYEYSRISTEEILISAEIDESILNKIHKDLILFNTKTFVDLALKGQNAQKIRIDEYLKESSLEIKRNWGISLGIGKFKIGSTDTKELGYKSQQTIKNGQLHTKIAFEGIRKYQESGNLGGFGNDYWVSFNAAMDTFELSPGTAHFDYGFSFFLDHDQKKFNKKDRIDLLRILDMAVLWDILPQSEFEEQQTRLWQLIGKESRARDITFSFQLDISTEAFDQIKVLLTKLIFDKPDRNLAILAESFGKAMPYFPNYTHRSDIQKRGQAYGQLWKKYFELEAFNSQPREDDFRVYTAMAKLYFKSLESKLSGQEGRYVSAQGKPTAGDNIWFGGLIRVNTPARNIKNFVLGLEQLVVASNNNHVKFAKILKRAFNKMQDAWKLQFCIKALGIYFIALARAVNAEDQIESQLEIKYTDAEGTKKAIYLRKGEML
jgi:hypothetical protein